MKLLDLLLQINSKYKWNYSKVNNTKKFGDKSLVWVVKMLEELFEDVLPSYCCCWVQWTGHRAEKTID